MKTLNLNRIFVVISVCVILLFFMLNVYTPLITDDYSFSLGINSLSDIIKSQYERYFGWDGRNVSYFLIEFWLLAGKPLFNIANTLVYCSFMLLVQFHITGNAKKLSPGLFLAINIFFWFLTPAWGQNFLWVTGSCVFLWTASIVLLFLVPFRKRQENPDYELNLPLSVFSFRYSGRMVL